MGDEADVLARLSRVLETQSLGFGSVDDNSSTAEMLSKLNNEIGDVSIAESKNDGYNRSMMMSKVQMPNRKTPYEVWAETQQTEVVKTPPKLKNKDFDSLVAKLHSSNKHKEQTIMARSNANLAEELKELNFKPELNRKSVGYTKDRNSKLEDRQDGMIQKRNNDLEKQRNFQREQEMKECTFKPDMLGKKKGEKYLSRSGNQTGGVDDMMRWEKEKKTRRAQRQQIVEEMEERELSFTPHLNRRSLMLTDKMKRDGKLTFNKDSGQTETTPRAHTERLGLAMGAAEPGHEEETFKPNISSRAASFTPKGGKAVHTRLYDHAVNQQVTKHNEQLEMKKALLNGVPMAKWETERMEVGGGASKWVVDVKQAEGTMGNRERNKSRDGMIELGGEAPINVLEYNPKYNFILEKIRFGGD